MAASEAVRLRLQFDYPPPAAPHCTVFWLLVDLNRCRVVTDLISLIRQRFGFSSGALLGLYLEGGLLPPAESARLVRDNDCLRVKLEESGIPENLVIISNGDHDSHFSPRKTKKRAFSLVEDDETELGYSYSKKLGKTQENRGHHDKALGLEPKAGRKKSKRKSQATCGTADDDDDEQTKRNSAKRKERRESKKQTRSSKSGKAQPVREWPTQNCHPPKGSPRGSLAKSRRKGRAGTEPKEATTSSESEPSHESNCDGHSNATLEADNSLKKLSAELLKEGLSTKTVAANKQAPKSALSSSKGKAARASSSSDSGSESDDQSMVSKNASEGAAAGLLKAVGVFAGRGCPGPGSSSQALRGKLSDSMRTPALPPSVSLPTSLGRGWGRGEDFLSWKGARGRGARGKGRGRGAGALGVASIFSTNTEGEKQQQLSEMVTNTSTIIQNPVEVHRKDYSLLPLLAAAPQVGEKIAFKLLELTSNYSPDVSDYKEGKILSHNPESQLVDIEILSSLPALKEPGKFDLVYHNENGTEVVEYAVTQERKITVFWKELIDPRLIIESSSSISSTELVSV
uniref:coilin n=1 Tax=Jaculus jaculus TaxID=51337 RepID=UPI001E1B0203|nr:coilin [Jaculus jaculus]